MSAEVKVLSNNAAGVIILPMSVIQFDDNNIPYIFKKDDKNKINKVEITTGINDGISVEIKSGVSDGEAVYYTAAASTASFGFPGGRGDFGGGGN
jgi:HlyD family secretion protein